MRCKLTKRGRRVGITASDIDESIEYLEGFGFTGYDAHQKVYNAAGRKYPFRMHFLEKEDAIVVTGRGKDSRWVDVSRIRRQE